MEEIKTNALKSKNEFLSKMKKLIEDISSNFDNLISIIDSDENKEASISIFNNIEEYQKNIKDTKKLEESQLQIIKDFNSEEFNIIDMLGEGTFSQIFLVENGKTKERFALKKMTATKLENLEEKKEEFELILKLKNEDEKLRK